MPSSFSKSSNKVALRSHHMDRVLEQLCEGRRKEVLPGYWHQVLIAAKLHELIDFKAQYKHFKPCIIEGEWFYFKM